MHSVTWDHLLGTAETKSPTTGTEGNPWKIKKFLGPWKILKDPGRSIASKEPSPLLWLWPFPMSSEPSPAALPGGSSRKG